MYSICTFKMRSVLKTTHKIVLFTTMYGYLNARTIRDSCASASGLVAVPIVGHLLSSVLWKLRSSLYANRLMVG